MTSRWHPTYVYVIGLLRLSDCCKIGVSKNPEKRILEISTGTPFVPVIVYDVLMATSGQAYKVEKESHRALESFRANGEWFWVSPVNAWSKVVKPISDRINTYREPKEREIVDYKVFPEKKFVIPKTTEECVIETNAIRARREATDLQSRQTDQAKVPA